MALSREFVDYVLEQLERLGGVSYRRMFGGGGLYRDGLFFGVLVDDTLYLKTDAENRPDYQAVGAQPFNPRPQHSSELTYFSVPIDVIEQPDELAEWARKALAAAARKPAARPRRTARS